MVAVNGMKSERKKKEKRDRRIAPKFVDFLVLLRQLPVDVGLDLVELQLDAESFAFFMLQSALRQKDASCLKIFSGSPPNHKEVALSELLTSASSRAA